MISPHEFVANLEKLIKEIESINSNLASDVDFFSKNDHDAIQVSNTDKQAILGHIQVILSELLSCCEQEDENLLQIFRRQVMSFSEPHQSAGLILLDSLKLKLETGMENLSVNSRIVQSNLNGLKATWDQFQQAGSRQTDLYEKPIPVE